jgi:hypothetical protein
MANYNKSTNFTAKDSLPTGNPSKIVKGSEIDIELNAVSNAIASKSDINSPTFTGTPAAPTAIQGSNTTQVANTAFVKTAIDTATAGLGTMSTQNKTAVDITGGTINGVTITSLAADLAVADGGTGRSTLAANAVLVGNGTSGINSVAPGTSGNVLKSNGTAWTSATLKGIGIGGEVWTNLTGSRALGTTYTNTRGYPIMISVNGTGSGSSGISIVINGNGVYFHQAQWNGPGAFPAAAIIIPDGATYSVTMSTSGLSTWWELF